MRLDASAPALDLNGELVSTLEAALAIRVLRNSCREYLTNHREPIGILEQARWFRRSYLPALRSGTYRLHLFCDGTGRPVGYGALLLKHDELWVTECVGAEERGKGYGKAILGFLLQVARRERRDVVAEIWASNQRSIALHRAQGFVLRESHMRDGSELQEYVLQREEQEDVLGKGD